MAKMGRPSIYTDELAATILGRISNGESLRSITMEEGMPNPDTIYVWLLKRPDFAENYTRAREEQADTLADEILAIADETPDSVTDEKGISRTDSGWVTWQRNRVDARKWVASKLKPKKYGDALKVGGDKDNPLAVTVGTEVFDSVLETIAQQKRLQKPKK
tara:strand:+ start:10652 stop:11134 length:483 start_codon:yes stop_codon:yes gene_type:complete